MIHLCDGRTNGRAIAYSALSICYIKSRAKNRRTDCAGTVKDDMNFLRVRLGVRICDAGGDGDRFCAQVYSQLQGSAHHGRIQRGGRILSFFGTLTCILFKMVKSGEKSRHNRNLDLCHLDAFIGLQIRQNCGRGRTALREFPQRS